MGKLRDSVIVTYNVNWALRYVARWAQREGALWTPIVADVPNKESLAKAERLADGVIYLSWGLYTQSLSPCKLHLDGGIDHPKPRPLRRFLKRPLVIYSGSMAPFGGVHNLLKAWVNLNPEATLAIVGHGDDASLRATYSHRSDIVFHGFVSEGVLAKLCGDASVFVNPRLISYPGNAENFPSKLLEYLSWCAPVVSTWTAGLHPSYRDVTIVTGSDTPDQLSISLKQVLAWNAEQRITYAEKVSLWLVRERLWSWQGVRLRRWLTELCGQCPVDETIGH